MATNPINSLDFDTIKANLIAYLKGQTQFKDYDFEGAGLNILMDLLAYNTHYQGYYANMVANETFLDSAMSKASVVSIAKHLNYLPKSYKCATAYVNVEFLNIAPNSTIYNSIAAGTHFINQGDRFIALVNNRGFVFTSTEAIQVKAEQGRYFARNVPIREGDIRTQTFVFDSATNINQRFAIPDLTVDVDTISVRVAKSVSDDEGIDKLWNVVTDINLADAESLVYFIQQNSDGYYEIYFGDNIVGKQPSQGNVIMISFVASSGSDANGLGKHEVASAPTFRYAEYASTKTLLLQDDQGNAIPSSGGSEPETIQSIKYYAPRNYQAQERAVTAEDYRVLIAKQYGTLADSVFVWGGEDNDPPIYGKVFISVKPTNAEKLTTLQKIAIQKNILKTKNVVSILPEIVDPDYLYLQLTINVKYDAAKTTLTPSVLASNIQQLVYAYSQENIGKFDHDFLISQFSTFINTSYNPPVTSNTVSVVLEKRLEPNLTSIGTYAINFDNTLLHPLDGYTPILSSSSFQYQDSTSAADVKPLVTAYLDDDGYGNVRVFKSLNGAKIYLNERLGTIDYTTGKINLINFAPQSLNVDSRDFLRLMVYPQQQSDILSRRNQILLVEKSGIQVAAVPQTFRYDPYSASGTPFRGTN